jgi:hypothetical protein
VIGLQAVEYEDIAFFSIVFIGEMTLAERFYPFQDSA